MPGFEAAPAQQRLWLLDQLGGARDLSHTLIMCVRFDGALDVERLATAAQAVIARHDVLRSVYRLDGTRLLADVGAAPVEVAQLGSRTSSHADGDAVAMSCARELAATPIDLAHGPLMRAAAIADGPWRCYLAVAVHHIAWDGWSVGVLLRELATAYARGPQALPPLTASYWDYAREQLQLADSERAAHDLAYWTQQLAELSELPPLAAAEEGEDEGEPLLHHAAFELDPRLAREVTTFARARGATAFAVFAAGLQTLLYKAGLGPDSCLGVPVSNRGSQRYDGIVGCFLNAILLRGSIREDDTFETLVARVRDATFEAIAHAGIPMGAVVRALGRDVRAAPLHQVGLSFDPTQGITPDVGGAPTTVLFGTPPTGRRDPTIVVRYAASRVLVDIEWNGRLVLVPEQLVEEWCAIVETGSRTPHARLGDVSLGPEGSSVIGVSAREMPSIRPDATDDRPARDA